VGCRLQLRGRVIYFETSLFRCVRYIGREDGGFDELGDGDTNTELAAEYEEDRWWEDREGGTGGGGAPTEAGKRWSGEHEGTGAQPSDSDSPPPSPPPRQRRDQSEGADGGSASSDDSSTPPPVPPPRRTNQ